MAEPGSGITRDPIDVAELESAVAASTAGAVVTFRGVVRDHDDGRAVTALEYEAHPDAAAYLERACATIAERGGLRVVAVHRIGELGVGDVALVACVASAHRAEAFAACSDLVDLIKQTVPIWKRQTFTDGRSEWVGL
ncbi:molybdenum cofactor biosynthesis protein MoaE [Schumannella sp. 10F1B-5-1]|uniref:molybdenum cofactor biosynthesis protein MoaE n=1 Tax=Schumannella sp. 10F1B-5-1 TaxID=2590780 RepID=UPI001130AAE1|nr:molybdenum cofactor biosynthesis protein MoaE [Schumannella sp. 10F1B-5-1]TPW72817.1 molybdenum cofactor biosynthesis protein MoaE [Schumannella sp. 10F1B-5-1]